MVEFALIALAYFMLLFGIIELARIMYMYNTLAQATRIAATAAANIDFNNAAALDRTRLQAVFRTTPGTLAVGDPVTDQNIRIDYLYLARQGNGSLAMTPIPAGSLPACPSRNRHNCLVDPYSSTCIRLVRARVCTGNANSCDAVQYEPLFKLLPFHFSLPTSPTIVTAESLGYSPGDALCN